MYYPLIEMDSVLIAEGRVDSAQGDPKILVDKLVPVRLDELDAMPANQPAAPAQPETNPADLAEDFLDEYLPDIPFGDLELPGNDTEETDPVVDEDEEVEEVEKEVEEPIAEV